MRHLPQPPTRCQDVLGTRALSEGPQQGGGSQEGGCSQASGRSRGAAGPPGLPRLLTAAPCPGRWTFGDGEQAVSQFKPPYDESFEVPDPMVAQVLVGHNTSHTYTVPGEGRLPPSRPAARACSALGQRLPGGQSLGPASRMQPGLMAWGPY